MMEKKYSDEELLEKAENNMVIAQELEDFKQNKKENNITLPENQKYLNIVAFNKTDFDISIKNNTINITKFQKLKYDINQVKEDKIKDVFVVLGGDNFYYYPKMTLKDMKTQVKIIAKLFEPIKDKIGAVIAGDAEKKIQTRARNVFGENFDPTKEICKKLGIVRKHFPNGVDLKVNFKNELTENKNKSMFMHIMYSDGFVRTNKTVGYKLKFEKQLYQGFDIYMDMRHSNSSICRISEYVEGKELNQQIQKPVYLISIGGYKNLLNIIHKRNRYASVPQYTDNKVYSLCIGKNYYHDIKRGNNSLDTPEYITHVSRHDLAPSLVTEKHYSVAAEYERIKTLNEDFASNLIAIINENKNLINKDNFDEIVNKAVYEDVKDIKEVDNTDELGI